MKNDKITGRTIEFNGRTFTSPAVYPRFAFWCDEITGKIAIANVDENTKNITEATEPFVDEVKYSELPLKTWTADYVVVRIGGYWYLTDSFGNCYYESKKPYIICRNVFVEADKTFIINKKLEKDKLESEKLRIDVIESGGYLFAYAYEYDTDRTGWLINSNGEINKYGTVTLPVIYSSGNSNTNNQLEPKHITPVATNVIIPRNSNIYEFVFT